MSLAGFDIAGLDLGEISREIERQQEKRRYDWKLQARPEQLPPAGEWRFWLIMAGRGWGKTRTIAEYLRMLAFAGKHRRIAILGATAADVRDVIVEGDSGIIAISPPDFMPLYEPSKRQLTWPNGVIAKTYSADEPDRLRGPQHHAAVVDELAAYEYPESFTQLKFGLRLGNDVRCVIGTTPKPCAAIRELVKQSKEGNGRVVITRGSTYDNRKNLAPEFFTEIIRQYEGTRLGRQELEGELLEDTPGALWNTLLIDRTRVKREDLPPMARIVVAIDPSVTSNARSDECGIAVVGKGVNGDGYMLEDLSGVMTPNEWAMAAISAYHRHSADVIVGETNNGGDLVGNTILALDPGVPFRKVTASRGKHLRAEPISLLSEQGRFHLVGNFPKLEEQMCSMSSDGYSGHGSPDRCFVAGTLIRTEYGDIPIENVLVGDLVHTRAGLRPVIAAGLTEKAAMVSTVRFVGGSLTGTGNHPVFVENIGYVSLSGLRRDDKLVTWPQAKKSLSTGSAFTDPWNQKVRTLLQVGQPGLQVATTACIGTYGPRSTAKFRQDLSSTIKTKTPGITTFPIWSASAQRNTAEYMARTGSSSAGSISPRLGSGPISGIPRRKGVRGIACKALKDGKERPRPSKAPASFVALSAWPFSAPEGSVPLYVKGGTAKQSARILSSGNAPHATSRSRLSGHLSKRHARGRVRSVCAAGTAPVYNLTVADAHEYYANGVLVHNCDAMVWGASEVMLGGTTVQMFPDFRAAHRGNGEPAQAVHVVDMGDLKDWWTRWISVTMGSSSAAHWWCREPAQPGKVGSRSRIYREFLAQDMTPEEFGAQIAQRSQQEAKISRILPVWLTESAFSGVQGKSVAAAVAEGIQRSLGQHKAFLFVHDDEERGIVDPQQRWRAFSARMDRMPTGFLSVQPIKGKDSDGWDVVREMLRWRPAASGRLEGPDWDYARQLVLTDYPAYERYISEFKEPDVEVLPELLISNQCKGVIQAMSGAVRTNDDSALAMGGGSFVLQSLRIGALASREDASREPMQEFVGRKLAALPLGASGTARHMAAMKAEQDWGGQHGMGPISFSRKRK